MYIDGEYISRTFSLLIQDKSHNSNNIFILTFMHDYHTGERFDWIDQMFGGIWRNLSEVSVQVNKIFLVN